MTPLLRTSLALVVVTPAFVSLASCSGTAAPPIEHDPETRSTALELVRSFRYAPEEPLRDAKREAGAPDVLWLGQEKQNAGPATGPMALGAPQTTLGAPQTTLGAPQTTLGAPAALYEPSPRGRRVIEPSPGVKLTATSQGFAVVSPTLSRKLTSKPAKVTLPGRLDAGFRVEDEGTKLGLDVKLAGATSSAGEIAEAGLVVYEDGYGKGRHVVHRPHAEGVEDYVVFEERPAVEELRYEVRVPAGAGLRLVSNVLEVVDEGGAPRVRMTAPEVVEKDGARVVPRVRVEGCRVDESAKLPWGRAIVSPGAEACSVVIGWAAGAYPVVVDPAWTTTGSMATARYLHTATALASGKVLIAGGYQSGALASTEVYDPATGTWASGETLTTARHSHTATALASGKVLVAGGDGPSGFLASAEVYDPGTGTWASGGTLTTARGYHTATALASGKVLVAGGGGQGGFLASAEVYDPGTDAWTSGGTLMTARYDHTATVLTSGKVLVAAGRGQKSGYLASAELYDPGTGAWASGGTLTTARREHTATALASGKVLVAAGRGQSGYLASAELYDPGTGTWTSGGTLTTTHHWHTATALASGKVLVAGGEGQSGYLASAELYDPGTGAWTSGGTLTTARRQHTATALASGKVLVAGGEGQSGRLASAEVWALETTGGTCSANEECTSGKCVDGVCCATACDGVCEACSQAKTGQPDGTCAPVLGDTDPDGDCSSQGAGVCQTSGFCNGQGACADKSGTACSATVCLNTATQKNPSTCDATGNCVLPVPATTDCAPYACKGTACLTACADGTDCVPGSACIGGQCQGPKANGKACGQADDCLSGFCVDGVCCNNACDGDCQACTAAKTGGTTGTCGGVQCPGKFQCDANVCPTSCTTSDQCQTGNVCVASKCVPPSANGKACDPVNKGADCTSSFCVDGVCCDSPCKGQCEACDVSGKVGQCVPVPKGNVPHNVSPGGRQLCAGGNDAICHGVCDGASANVCTYPGPAIHCGDLCEQDSFVAGLCDSAGGCAKQKGMPCAPYTCDLDVKGCKTSCTTNADCAAGNVCNSATETCGPSGSQCADTTHVKGTNGQVEACPPGYSCSSATGACNTKCSTSAECDTAGGYKCEGTECKKGSGAGGAAGSGGGSAGAGGSSAGAGGSSAGAGGGAAGTPGGAGAGDGAGTGGTSTAGGSGTAGSGAAGKGAAGSPGSAGANATPAAASEDSGGCGCEVPRSSGKGWQALAAVGLALAARRRRAR